MKNNTRPISFARRFFVVLGLTALMITASTCKRNVIKVNRDYVGEWSEGEQTTRGFCFLHITISSKGDGATESWGDESDCKRAQKTDGKARTNGKSLSIGLRKFKVIEEPTRMDTMDVRVGFREFKSAMRMQLDDHILYKLLEE
jgi:hypothetical protein